MEFDMDNFGDFIDGFGDYAGNGGSSFGSQVAQSTMIASSIISTLIGIAALVLTLIALWKIFVKAGKPGWHALIPFLNVYDIFQIGWKRKTGIATIILSACGGFLMFLGLSVMVVVFGRAAFFTYMDGRINSNEFVEYLLNMDASAVVWIMLFLIGTIVLCVGSILLLVAYIKLGAAFGKSGGFQVGLFFLPFIFLPILAFGQATYQGHWDKDGFVPDPQGYGPGPNPNPYSGQSTYTQPQNPGMQPQNPGMQAGTYDPGIGSVSDIPEAPRYCSGCGTVITPGSKFCASCGKQLVK